MSPRAESMIQRAEPFGVRFLHIYTKPKHSTNKAKDIPSICVQDFGLGLGLGLPGSRLGSFPATNQEVEGGQAVSL